MSHVHIELTPGVHDEARILAAQFTLPAAPAAAVVAALRQELETLCVWAEETGVLIGHIKAFLNWEAGAVMLSTTGAQVDVKGLAELPAQPEAAQAGVAAIVFGVEPEELELRVTEALDNALAAVGFECRFTRHQHDHHHDECHDESCHCHDHDHDECHDESCHCHDHDHDECHDESCHCHDHDHHHD